MQDHAKREKIPGSEIEPVPGDIALEEALSEIAEDAQQKPRRYARDSLVPEGGE